MKTTLPFIAFLCLYLSPLSAQIIFYEDFEGDFETNSWVADPVWKIGTASTLSSTDFIIPDHNQFAAVNDDGVGAGVPSFGAVTSAEIDLTGINFALLRFDCYFVNGDFQGVDETARVLVSTDAMATWSVLLDIGGSGTWQSIILPLGAGLAGEKIHLAFEYDDNDGWNYGFCLDNVKVELAPDYLAQVNPVSSLEYTVSTSRQLNGPLHFIHRIDNFGSLPLEGLSVYFEALIIFGGGTILQDSHLVATIPPGGTVFDTIAFLPEEFGKHSFIISASHPQLGQDFYDTALLNAFELSDSTLARDDGARDFSIGMSFGDPNWYGYYGSEFDLNVADTLTGISVWMTTSSAGSFNLTVNTKDATGSPTIELMHSNPIPIAAGFNNWVYFPLAEEMPLAAGNYVFAVGQDTIQGVMGHGFDDDRFNPGYWIMSPVAGGGYPWFNSPTGQTLMIRPHFKPQPVASSVFEPAYSTLKVYPNPASAYVQFELENAAAGPFQLTLTDAAGRVVISEKTNSNELKISHLPPGLYFLKIQDGERAGVAKLMKR